MNPVNMPGLSITIQRQVGGSIPTPVAGTASYIDGSLGASAIGNLGPQALLDNLPANLQPGSTLFYYNPQEEDLLLQQAALQQTGKASFVDGLSYDSKTGTTVTEQEKAYLYQNALDYAKANNVQLGDALTQAQVNALDKPMLWYVEQTVPDPSCMTTAIAACPTVTALMPQVYLPSDTTAMSAGGNIQGTNVTLNFNQDGNGSILNTGSISASDTLTVNTNTLTNQANQVDIGQIWSKVKGGYLDETGTTVQPGGFMSAANMDLNVQTLNQIGGALQQLNADGTVNQAGTQALLAQLQQQLGTNFTQTTVSDNIHTDFVKDGGGMPSFVVAAIAIAASIVTAGAAAAIAGVVMTQLTIGTVLVGALGGMVGSIAGQLASGQSLNFGQIMEAGVVGGITAGAFAGLSETGMGFGNLQQAGAKIANGSFGAADLPKVLETIAARGVVSAGVNTTVYGGSFGQALEGSVIGDVGALGASAIGTEFNGQAGKPDSNSIGYLASHAALGCALSAASGTGCAGGAIGGAVSAFAAETIAYDITSGQGNPNSAQLAAITALSMLAGGGVAGALGQNASGAAFAAENETLNNTCGSDDPHGCGKKLGAMGATFGAASAFLASLVGDEVTAGGNIPWTMQEIAAGASVGQRIGSTIGAGADALLSEGNSQAGGGNQSTQGQTLANSRAAHDAASNEIANGFTEQGALVQKEVTLDSTSAAGTTVRARADQVVTGTPNGTLQVPNGYYATDLNNNVITQIPLNSAGQVIIEVKTGSGDLTPNQGVTYPAAQSGNAVGAGRNAANANVQGQVQPTQVVIIRPKA